MDDVAIAGAGPAGALAATILAKAGLRVSVFDRARFPRHKLCGDTLNPGALSVLRRHADVSSLIANGDPIEGMLLTGPGGVQVRGVYGAGVTGRSITRRVFDQWMVDRAVASGAGLHEGVLIREAATTGAQVDGVVIAGGDGLAKTHRARMVIAADGRRSAIAIARKLAHQPQRPRRWAIGGYFSDVSGTSSLGEMHVRRGHYIGVAPVPGGLTNACLVLPYVHPSTSLGASGVMPLAQPAEALREYLSRDPDLSARFANARAVAPPTVLGPMAVDATAAGEPGLLLAGDAAGFIDPMTGDGLRFALVGAELAAAIVLEVLEGKLPLDRAHVELEARRRSAFQSKWRFNRGLRALVSSPSGVSVAAVTARVWPSVFGCMIRFAGDCQ